MDSGGTETRNFEPTGAQSQAQAPTQNQAPVQAQTQVHVRTEGFTTLSDGGELPVVDIVFIHGLGGHPKWTWTSTEVDVEATETSATAALLSPTAGAKTSWKKIFHIKRPKQSMDKRNDGFFWPQAQLAKDFTAARILTYGYDCSPFKLFEAADRRGIIDHGDDLLSALADRRGDAKDRPIIFVVHSLGGLILKRALWKSRNATGSTLKKVFEQTIGILFYGTPHRGGNYANLGDALVHAVNVLGHSASAQIVNNLKRESEVLELLREEFRKMLDDNHFVVHSFYETKGLSFHRTMSEKVVDKTSAIIEHSRENARSAAGNHMEMCKFTGAGDTRYEAVKIIVGDLLQPELVQGIEEKSMTEACLKTLTFERRQAWVTEIHDHTEGTTVWLQQNPTFTSWLKREQTCEIPELLWLEGKPGSGKSTLLKALMKSWMKSSPKLSSSTPYTCAAFFFARKGSPKEKSSKGLFQSIIYQLMEADPAVCVTMRSRYEEKKRSLGAVDGASLQQLHWTTAELESMLENIFKTKSTRPTIILIDSVDECGEEKDAKDVVKFCRNILRHASNSGVTLNICISSRSNFVRSEGGHVLVLDQLNAADIDVYVRARIKRHGTSASKLTASVEGITTKSAGIFLWARLAMDILLDNLDDGWNVMYLMTRLEELPPEIEDIYKRMLVCPTSESEADRHERLRFFQWIIFANRPLTLRELYTIIGMIQIRPPSSLGEWSRSIRNPVEVAEEGAAQKDRKFEDIHGDRGKGQDQLLRWIRRVSRGLVEVSHSPEKGSADKASSIEGQGSVLSNVGESRTINVIHTSVREFFRHSLTFGGLGVSNEQVHDISPQWNTMGRLGDEELRRKTIVADGHAAVLQTCLRYLYLEELDNLAKLRQDTASMASASLDDIIYYSDRVQLAFSAASSQFSSEGLSNDGRLRLAALKTEPVETGNLKPAALEELPLDTNRTEDWLNASTRPLTLETAAASDLLWQPWSIWLDHGGGAGEIANLSDQRSNIFERSLEQRRHPTYDSLESAWNVIPNSEPSNSASASGSALSVQFSLPRIELDSSDEIRQSYEELSSTQSTASHRRDRASVEAVVGDIYSFLQYSSDEIFTHARNFELQSLRMSWLVDTLMEAWERIVMLREDVRKGASFLQFCMQAGKAGSMDRLIVPVLEHWRSHHHAVDVFLWAMAKNKKDIVREIVERQIAFEPICNRFTEDLKGPDRTGEGWDEFKTKRTPLGVKPLRFEYEWLLIRLLGPVEHKTRYTTTPISRADAFSCWKEHFDAVQEKSEEKMSVSIIRQILETGEPGSPLSIAFRARKSSPDIHQAMINMGKYSDDNTDSNSSGVTDEITRQNTELNKIPMWYRASNTA